MTITIIEFQGILIPLKETPHSLEVTPLSPLENVNLLSVSLDVTILDISNKWNQSNFVSGFFRLACFQVSSVSRLFGLLAHFFFLVAE